MTMSKLPAGLLMTMIAFASNPALAADTNCGGAACEESICSSASVIECSDWNNGSYDGGAVSANAYTSGESKGGVVAGKGMNGTKGWEHKINVADADTVWFDKAVVTTNAPLYERMYVKFSPGYQFMMICGLQKMFYFNKTNRIMVGVTKASDMGGSYASQPNTVGLLGFDYSI